MRLNSIIKRPDFSAIDYSMVEKQLDDMLARHRAGIVQLERIESPGWNNFISPQQTDDGELEAFWSPISHLNSVLNSAELRAVYNAGRAKLTDFGTEVGQNTRLFEQTQRLRNSDAYKNLSPEQRRVVDNRLRDFRLSGVSLNAEDKTKFKEISIRLSELTTRFSENILDCSNQWEHLVIDEQQLSGLPSHAINAAAQRAAKKDMEGWLLNLDFPTYYAVITFANNQELRRTMYTAWNTRASDQGPHDDQFDNSSLMQEILSLRQQKAKLLGFDSYANLSIETKMVNSPDDVLSFLRDLAARAMPLAQREMQELKEFVRVEYRVDTLEAWDVAYYSDKLKKQKFDISEEDLKPYFPAAHALKGMFDVVGRLFGIRILPVADVARWHPDVEYYEIIDAANRQRGAFYLDTYARENKRSGAWMDVCLSRHLYHDHLQLPIAYLTCNLTPPVGGDPALLTHQEVTTLFHEFGHGLHHMLTEVDYSDVSGIHGVEWDAVELPSQFLENWCWEREALDLISAHYLTGAPIPQSLLEKAQSARNFQSAMQMIRQIEFATFDMRLHCQVEPVDIQTLLDAVRREFSVWPTPAFNRFQHAFSHIFAGGYAAGYFSYKWAEVLSADAYSRFEDEGIFNPQTGYEFLTNILERGGTRDAMELFVAFRGREPSIGPLLRHSGLAA